MGFTSDVTSKGAVTGRGDYLWIDGTLRVEEDGTHSKISIHQDGKGFKVGCTRVDEDAMWKIIDFVQGRPTP